MHPPLPLTDQPQNPVQVTSARLLLVLLFSFLLLSWLASSSVLRPQEVCGAAYTDHGSC